MGLYVCRCRRIEQRSLGTDKNLGRSAVMCKLLALPDEAVVDTFTLLMASRHVGTRIRTRVRRRKAGRTKRDESG